MNKPKKAAKADNPLADFTGLKDVEIIESVRHGGFLYKRGSRPRVDHKTLVALADLGGVKA